MRYSEDVGGRADFVWCCYEAGDCNPLSALALACDLVKRLNPELVAHEVIVLRAARRKVRGT